MIEYYVAQAVHDAVLYKSNKTPSGEYISERYYRNIMREIQSRYEKKESKEIPDYLKGKFIKLPADLKEKSGIVAIYFLDE